MMTPQEIERVNELYQQLDHANDQLIRITDDRDQWRQRAQLAESELRTTEDLIVGVQKRLMTEQDLQQIIDQIKSVTVKPVSRTRKKK
jgi:hypothetical protein